MYSTPTGETKMPVGVFSLSGEHTTSQIIFNEVNKMALQYNVIIPNALTNAVIAARVTKDAVSRHTDGGTRVTLQHSGFASPEVCESTAEGWRTSLARLAELLSLRHD